MILEIFTYLSNALQGNPLIAILASFIWGILSIILSPCHLSTIPLIIGFISNQSQMTVKRASIISTLFALGILVTIGFIGLITGLLGRMLGNIGPYGNYMVAVVFLFVGLYLLDLLPFSFCGVNASGYKKKGLLAAFILGLIFGVALGPCTFAYMAPMLGVAFTVASHNLLFAISLILAYAIGHCSVIIFAGSFTELISKFLAWNENSKGLIIIKKICGILVIAGGIYMIIGNK
jgi:cytochrome c-type biogenesis protein